MAMAAHKAVTPRRLMALLSFANTSSMHLRIKPGKSTKQIPSIANAKAKEHKNNFMLFFEINLEFCKAGYGVECNDKL